MYMVYVSVETYGGRYVDRIEMQAADARSARRKAERLVSSRHGDELVCLQITDVSKI